MKAFLRISLFCTVAGMMLFLICLSIFFLPVENINRLKHDYVQVEFIGGKAQYTISSRKPVKWVSLKMVDHTAVHAIVISEDWGYYQHHGIDFRQIYTAVEDTIFNGKTLRGASTITQQVVKNLFLTNEKSFWRKVKEAFFAVSLEAAVSKDKILEIYLNIIEYGDTVYGIYDASIYYFNKTPLALTPREGAFLAMVLPSPKKYSHSFEQGELTAYASKTIDSILGKMMTARYLSWHQMINERLNKFSWEYQGHDIDARSL